MTAVSPRLPSGARLALTATMTATTAALTTVPALAAAPARAAAGDQIRSQEWWLAGMHVAQAWQFTQGAGVTVAVLSTGVDGAHPDLTGSVVTGPDYTGSGRVAGGPFWGAEGTSAASLIAGHGDGAGDASGIAGIAPAAKVLSIRVALDATDPLNASAASAGRLPDAIAQGIRYAAGHGAQVIDLPLDPASLPPDGAVSGGLHTAAGGSPAERAAAAYAVSQGAVLVAPAGDDGASGNAVDFPAAYPDVIALGAVDQHFARPQFASRQSYVALTAPGVNVTAASPPAGYRTMTTTDAASAMAAGVAALIRSRYPDLTASQVRQALVDGTVSPAGQPGAGAPGYGTGTLDALKAVQAAIGITAAPATAPAAAPAAQAGAPVQGRPAGGTAGGTVTTGILGTAKALLRDAAMAAGLLIGLLVASLVGLRVRRRHPALAPRAGPQPRMPLSAPVAPVAPTALVAPAAPVAPIAPVAAATSATLAHGASVVSGSDAALSATGGARHAKPPAERARAGGGRRTARAGGRPVLSAWAAGPRPPWDPAPVPWDPAVVSPRDSAPVPRVAPVPPLGPGPRRAPVPPVTPGPGRAPGPPVTPGPGRAPRPPDDRPAALAGAVPDPPLPPRAPPGQTQRGALAGPPAPGRDRDAGSGPDSGPLYIWDPAALTDPFPAVPPPSLGEPDAGRREGPVAP
ncbi:MAG TPA: S8 family serine peptidase [Streptosporangiaceae bacterium]